MTLSWKGMAFGNPDLVPAVHASIDSCMRSRDAGLVLPVEFLALIGK
ncbi:MAG: hypothetical protein QOF41_153 [Methylobacteriaceae bacterium]|nr:hypothetical protein [Methylobacteriaceae bacterium]